MKYKIINKKKLFATIVADLIGTILFLPISIFKRKKEIDKEIRDILIIRTAYIGDIVMTFPVLKPLKEKYPQAKISFLASKEGAELLRNNPYIDRIFHFNPFWFYRTSIREYFRFISRIRAEKFDLVIEARGDIRELLFLVLPLKAKFKLSYDVGGGGYLLTHVVPYKELSHKVDYHLNMVKYLGCSTENIDLGVYLTEEEKNRVKVILNDNGIQRPFISVHPGARLPLKRWSSERYAILCDMLMKEYKMPLVILGTEGEKGIIDDMVEKMECKPLILAGKLNIRELAGVLAESTLFICNDSAPMHIAAAMKTTTVAIFGPSKSQETGPYGNDYRVVEKDFPCRFTCDENVCRYKIHNECMKAITPDDVYKAVKELIG